MSIHVEASGTHLHGKQNESREVNIPETIEDDESSREEGQTFCSRLKNAGRRACRFFHTYDFPILILLAIALARAYPPLGAVYLEPQITASWIAVILIFLLAGLGLKTEELAKAFKRLHFNSVVQIFNFGFVSGGVYAVTRLLILAHILDEPLADGMVICSCLSISINTVIVLTTAMGGDDAVAVFNTTFGNFVGIFLSPALILGYLGTSGTVSFGEVILKLIYRVLIPLMVGQALQKLVRQVREVFNDHKLKFKKLQEYSLIFIVYTVFCRTFLKGATAPIKDVMLMILFQFLLMLSFMALGWITLKILFRDEPELRCTGVLICVSKTIALGIPLITSMYQGNPNEALYTLPILIWHPMQLIVGSMFVPKFKEFIRTERERLKAIEDDSDESESAPGDVEVAQPMTDDEAEVSTSLHHEHNS